MASTNIAEDMREISVILSTREIRNQNQKDLLLIYLASGETLAPHQRPKNKFEEQFNECIDLINILGLIERATRTEMQSLYNYVFKTSHYPPDNEILFMLMERGLN
jgi:hypothetical protein